MHLESVIEALLDSLRMLPFLYAAYLLIEYIERRHGDRIEKLLADGGHWGCIPGALLGCVPQCGFSAAAANFYASRVITLGTLIAVFMATSDEALPLLFSNPRYWPQLAAVIGIKIVYGLVCGLVVDFGLGRVLPASLRGGYTGSAQQVDCHKEHDEEEEKSIWLAALSHTVEIFLFILAFSLAIEVMVDAIGEQQFAGALGGLGIFQPLLAALIGLIPNCAASVLLTELYLDGTLQFASLVAGLCSGAGVGLAVLWRYNRSTRQNLLVTVLLWLGGVVAGLLVGLLGSLFGVV